MFEALLLLILIGLLPLLVLAYRHGLEDRRRLEVIAARLQAEARMDALTRATITEMRRVVRDEARARRT